ncbi:PLAC8-domain-containing protein [Aspergillus ellipticus CBS 707.79]|uniref:PLAC8-domain-containing protein n=1 Tax=Aspergillus ellipticus CBS 707.79 TaxID=1448320 RepID=A0A319DHK1_9EURO|nr:PLAC8-domain-containing protein [Aspergillus ellipticus CBS 707.79]
MSRQLRLDTSNLGESQRYSFLPTPLEMHGPGAQLRSPAPAPNVQLAEQPAGPEQAPVPFDEKSQQYQQAMSAYGYPSGPSIAQHPANYAPYADEMPQQVYSNPSYPLPPPSPGPLPPKANPAMSDQPSSPPTMMIAPDANPLHSPPLPQFPPPVASGPPTTPAGVDVMAYHRPGQISHPDQEIRGGTWRTSLCGCSDIGACCLGLVCPCILYGKTQHRLSRKSRGEDPTNMLGYGVCNGSCTAMALLCGCHWLLATIQHTRTRKAYGIEGGIASDCIRATCCTCCALIQDETEIKKREEARGRAVQATGAAFVSPYLAPVQMSYGK